MKTGIQLPDVICREAESAASALGMTPNQFHASLNKALPETAMGKE